ncbi:MAG: sigma 54-interacting transcriptional regulator [Polyangiaceae bacterium]|nr:sigma 54-interacting transcriptional regulator [Polyangiaceae bacterium]
MQLLDDPPPADAGGGGPGLVLLYSPDYELMRPAYVFASRELTLGRDPEADIHIPGGAASRLHARIREEGGRWILTDLGGRNGTLVDGAVVDEVTLEHLHEIRVGDAIFKFVEADAHRYARYRIDGAIVEPGAGAARLVLPAGDVVGGYQIQQLASGLRDVAKSPLSVLILGESGTGKEVFAQQLHDWSGRRGAFQAVNCAAIPATLIEGELFGHRRGAFSGADRDRTGLIRAAHGGTLLLDEIGDMPLEAQAKLLRVIQSREIVPLGGTTPEKVDVRVVCATHRDLAKLQQSGAFRGDLFARINEYNLTLPPLRHRKEDVYALLFALAARHGQPDVKVTLPFMTGLLHYDFPYNVRELEALVKRWAAVARGPELGVEHFTDEIRENTKSYGRRGLPPAGEQAAPPRPDPRGSPPDMGRLVAPTEARLRELLAEHKGNVAAVGRMFNRDRKQVHRWLRRYNINADEYR